MEIWVHIKDYEKLYLISNLGKVLNLKTGKFLKTPLQHGYKCVALRKYGKSKTITIHRLLGIHFIKNFRPDWVINHIDGNKLNNNLNNLECITFEENIRHAWKIGLSKGRILSIEYILERHRLKRLNKNK